VAAAWDVAAVHRLLFGEWRAEPARAWARLQDLPLDTLPTTQPLDLFSHADWAALDPDDPLGPDGHLNPGWLDAAGPRHPPGCRPGPRWPGRPRTASRSR